MFYQNCLNKSSEREKTECLRFVSSAIKHIKRKLIAYFSAQEKSRRRIRDESESEKLNIPRWLL